MEDTCFPALYRSSDKLSLASQKLFFNALFLNLLFFVLAAGCSLFISRYNMLSYFQFFFLLLAACCSIFIYVKKPERIWYASRAIAESVKTLTWRFVSRAEPFDTEDARAIRHYGEKMREVVYQNREVASRLVSFLGEPQITGEMEFIRKMGLEERKKKYLVERVKDQLEWYAKKAKDNKTISKKWFKRVIIVNSFALFFAGIRIFYPNCLLWPTDVFVTLAASLLSWTQAKRFSELSTSYALAAHEISLFENQIVAIAEENDFSIFVGDAENAFSREHTQWVARRDI